MLYCLKTTQQFDSLYGGNDPRMILYKVCVFYVNTNIKGGLPLQNIVLKGVTIAGHSFTRGSYGEN
jgi:hypothetical protein